MVFKTKIWRSRKGLDTITSVFMLLIMFTALTILIVAFATSSQSVQDQRTLEQERAQEKITLTTIEVNNATSNIENVTIKNTGTIEVKIRALYEKQNGATTYVTDPSTSPINANTNIPPGEALKIQIASLNLANDGSTRIIAVTERGTQSTDEFSTAETATNTTISVQDTSLLYIGPLILNFTSFQYQPTVTGNLLPGSWLPGWSVPKSSKVAWTITVMNNDTQGRSITLSKYSSFTIANVEGTPQTTPTWYLKSTNSTNPTQLLVLNQNTPITFVWDAPAGSTPQSVYSQDSTCMVFLTFFGVYNNSDGTTTPYGQTIPFEAVIAVN